MAMSQWTSTSARWLTAGTRFKKSTNHGTEGKPQPTTISHTFASIHPSVKWFKKVSSLCSFTTFKANKLLTQKKWYRRCNPQDLKTIKRLKISWWSTSKQIGKTNVREASCSLSNLETFTRAACTMDCLVWFAIKRSIWRASKWWCSVMVRGARQACLCWDLLTSISRSARWPRSKTGWQSEWESQQKNMIAWWAKESRITASLTSAQK